MRACTMKPSDLPRETQSDRLKQLALPNSHLVEAVLKDHYHIFNNDCRNRLKKLLQLILNVNKGDSRFNEKFKNRCIRNLQRRIKSLEEAHNKSCGLSKKSEMLPGAGDHVSLRKVEDPKEVRVIFKAKDKSNEQNPTECGDCAGNEKSSVIKNSFAKREALKGTLDAGEDVSNARFSSVNWESDVFKVSKPKQDVPKAKNAQTKCEEKLVDDSKRAEDEVPRAKCLIDHSNGRSLDLPSLAIKYYVTLILDMQKNCKTYETFVKELIKPTEQYKQPYVDAAYKCWMEYLSYVKHTLEYLHPYIENLIKVCNTHKQGDPSLSEVETKLPKVLINSLKNMKPWRKALLETVECCRDLKEEGKQKRSISVNVHQLYVRYHKKINSLVKQDRNVFEYHRKYNVK